MGEQLARLHQARASMHNQERCFNFRRTRTRSASSNSSGMHKAKLWSWKVFYFTGLMVLVGRPGYRIVNRTIRRRSRVSNLIASSLRAQIFAYLAYHLSWFLFGSYLWGFSACHDLHDKPRFVENEFHKKHLLRFRWWKSCRLIFEKVPTPFHVW